MKNPCARKCSFLRKVIPVKISHFPGSRGISISTKTLDEISNDSGGISHIGSETQNALLSGGLVGMCLTFWDNSEQQRYLERHSFISVSFGITGERSNSTKASFCPHSLLMEWDREREPRGGCAEPGEKPEQGEPRCKSRVDSPV